MSSQQEVDLKYVRWGPCSAGGHRGMLKYHIHAHVLPNGELKLNSKDLARMMRDKTYECQIDGGVLTYGRPILTAVNIGLNA